MRSATSLLTILSLLTVSSSYKFLVYSPIFGYSQQKFVGAIADSLTAAGHDVTMLMPVQDQLYRDKPGVELTKKIIYVDGDDKIRELSDLVKNSTYKLFWTDKADASNIMENGKCMVDLFEYTCKYILQDQKLMKRLKDEKFDVGISEVFQLCGFGIFDILGLNKTIATGSAAIFEHYSMFIGEPLGLSHVPAMMSPYGDKMTLLQRVENVFNGYMGAQFFGAIFKQEYEALKSAYKDIKPIEELVNQASIMFTNTNPLLNFPHPILQKTIEVGGVSIKLQPANKLKGDLDKILSERKKNIFISFGSVAKSKDMPLEWKKSLLEVFTKMSDVTFIWKYEEPSDIADHLPNVYLRSWLPQTDLLADERLSLFVTHGGLGSITEVAYQGIPAIVIGLFAEQPRNGLMLARHGGALVVEKTDVVKPKAIETAFRKVLSDKSFAENALKLSQILREKPISNNELVVQYSEFVAKFGPLTQLDSYGRKLSLFEYYLIDAALIALGILLISVALIIFGAYRLIKMFTTSTKTKTD